MNTKTLAGIIIVAVGVIIAAEYFIASPAPDAQESASGRDTSALRAEENAVIVSEQRPGMSITVSAVFLAKSGFVVIHEDAAGAPGSILGASVLLPAGESRDARVSLSRASKDGEKLHAMLHVDANGNGAFDVLTDVPVQSRLGGPLEGWFEISSSASENIPVSI